MTYVLAGFAVAIGIQVVAAVLAVFMMRRRRRDLDRIEGRVTQLAEALTLLTDTTQAGFASLVSELERSQRPRAASTSRAATSRRIARAVDRGRAVRDVAADEQVSESEIRLHLGLASECSDALHALGSKRRSWLEPSTSL